MIEIDLKNISMKFETSDTVFSPMSIDRGTMAMLSQINFTENDFVLDLGCGYGVVGILASKLIGCDKVVMCDISEEAIILSKINAESNEVGAVTIIQSDGLNNIINDNFTLIIFNPPYHTDFSVAKSFIEKGYKKLVLGGKMYLVTKRLDWYKNKMTTIFGGVRVMELDGYYVFIAEKRPHKISSTDNKENKNHLSKKLKRKQRN